MINLTPRQERALSKLSPDAAIRRRKTMEAERAIALTTKHDDAVTAAGMGDLVISPFRRALRAGLGK